MELLSRLKQNCRTYGYRGLLLSALSRLRPPLSVTRVHPPHFHGTVLIRTRSSDISTYRQIFIEEEYAAELASAPKTIVDAGANVGYTSLYLSNRYPSATILAIEPESENFEMLKRNASADPHIIPIHAALWSENGAVELTDPGAGAWGFRTRSVAHDVHQPHIETVAAKTLPTLLAEYRIDTIDILKVDIEGAEVEVFRDAREWIDRVGVLMVELHDRITPGCTRAVLEATRDFEYAFQHDETCFFARAGYVPSRRSGSRWVERAAVH